MRELPDRYVFETLLDGIVSFHKKSYEKHSQYHPIGRPEDRAKIQEALNYPDLITKHDRKVAGRRFRHHTYYRFDPAYPKCWRVVIRLVGKRKRWRCVVTAFSDDEFQGIMGHRKEERIIYKKTDSYEHNN